MSTFWRDVKRGWNVGSKTVSQAVRGVTERIAPDPDPEAAARREADAEVRAAARPAPEPTRDRSPRPAAATTTTKPAPAGDEVLPPLPAASPDPTELSEAELADRIRRRTL